MTPAPPDWARRLLARMLGDSDDARAIQGDLLEDFAEQVGRRGLGKARRWYVREAVSLGLSHLGGGRAASFLRNPGRKTMDEKARRAPTLLADLTYAWRSVRRDRGFVSFAMVVIGLGVGACTAVYSVLSPLLIKPLPFPDSDRLVWIANDGTDGSLSAVTSRASNLADFRELATSFDGLTGFNAFFEQGSYNLADTGEPERLVGVGVAQDFLDVLGVQPRLGRSFAPEEGQWGGPAAAILTYGFWMRRFGGDPTVVGTAISIDEQPTEVVGILPETFDFSSTFAPAVEVDFLLPFPVSPETDQSGNTMSFVGRLRPGVSVEAAQAELDAVVSGLAEADPRRWGLGAVVSDLQEHVAAPHRRALLLLAAAAGTVLLIVCVNVSNLLLARGPRRRREMAVRSALGAERTRLIRQLLLETSFLSLGGALLGIVTAAVATRLVAGSEAIDIPLVQTASVDGAALLFAVGTALLTGLLVGAVPALQVASGGGAEAMRASSRAATASRGNTAFREVLVVAEVALACMLLVFGGLLLKSFQQLLDVELGFDPTGTVAWQISASRTFESPDERVAYYDALVTAVHAVPGVESAGLVDAIPLGRTRTWSVRTPEMETTEEDFHEVFPHLIDHRYLPTMKIPLVSGRGFTADDGAETSYVVVINESAARSLFPGRDPLGGVIRYWRDWEVVGVVADVRHLALDAGSGFQAYFPITQLPEYRSLDLVVRSPVSGESLVPAVSAAIHDVDPTLPVGDYRSLESVVDLSVSPRRFTLSLLSTFGASALFLAAIGIYGVLSYSVTERIPEIGIRMALGESSAEVRARVVRRTMALAVAGVGLGMVASLTVSRLVGALLYGVEPTDPATLATIAAILLAVAGAAGFFPALRASRTDTRTALLST